MKHLAFFQALTFVLIASPASAQDAGLDSWKKIYEVFSHPRCVNCHVPADNRPRWSGPSYGTARYHGMYVKGGESRIGAETLSCSTCHGLRNSDVPHGPPGADIWTLAPVEMDWWKKTSADLCAQIKDPEKNGGRSIEGIARHIDDDVLVQWAWTPGAGREAPPHSREALATFIAEWNAAGAPCPN